MGADVGGPDKVRPGLAGEWRVLGRPNTGYCCDGSKELVHASTQASLAADRTCDGCNDFDERWWEGVRQQVYSETRACPAHKSFAGSHTKRSNVRLRDLERTLARSDHTAISGASSPPVPAGASGSGAANNIGRACVRRPQAGPCRRAGVWRRAGRCVWASPLPGSIAGVPCSASAAA